LFLLSLSTLLAGHKVEWNDGVVVDNNGKVLSGEISFQTVDLILFRSQGQVSVFTPYQIKSFSYYDNVANVNRKFSSYQQGTARQNLFFELVVWGDIQVVRLPKGKSSSKRIRKPGGYNYLVGREDQFTKFDEFNRQIYPLLVAQSPTLHEAVQELQLSPYYTFDIIEIVRLYNRLGRPTGTIARNSATP